MSTAPVPTPRLGHILHALFLILVWGGYTWAGMSLAIRQVGARPDVVGGYLLFFVYSCLLCGAFNRWIDRCQWLGLPASQALPRIVAGVLVVGSVQTFLVITIGWIWTGTNPAKDNPVYLLLVWINTSLVTALITALFCTTLFFQRLKVAREHAKALEANAAAARLSALEAQMNPHFLFNSLNSLRAMISENPPQAQDMVTRLANILRYSLTRDSGRPVPFPQELEMVQDYLSLEAVRLEERLRVRLDIDPLVSKFQLPSLALQTLVENALKHGIAPSPQGGELHLKAELVEPDSWRIEVLNTGRLQTTTTSTRVGLKNLRDRLQLLYQDQAHFDLTERPDGWVCATLTLPRVRA